MTIPQIGKERGSKNYHSWRSMAITFLDIMGVRQTVGGHTPKPEPELEKLLHFSQRAKGFLLFNVEKGLFSLVFSAAGAPTAGPNWRKNSMERPPTTFTPL